MNIFVVCNMHIYNNIHVMLKRENERGFELNSETQDRYKLYLGNMC